jgi:hypothetical protein
MDVFQLIGKFNPTNDIAEWIETLEAACGVTGKDMETVALVLLPMDIRNKLRINGVQFKSGEWDAIKTKLVEWYGVHENLDSVKATLFALKQQPSQSVSEYWDVLDQIRFKLRDDTSIKEADLKRIFVQGLVPEVKVHAGRIADQKSLIEIVAFARSVESDSKPSGADVHLAHQSFRGGRGGFRGRGRGSKRTGAPQAASSAPITGKDIQCHYCTKFGHRASECRLKKQARDLVRKMKGVRLVDALISTADSSDDE